MNEEILMVFEGGNNL